MKNHLHRMMAVCTFVYLFSTEIVLAESTVVVELMGKEYSVEMHPEYTGSGYDRDNWDVWEPIEGTRFNTRDRVLIDESLVPVRINSGSSYWRTRVISGGWVCPYTGMFFTDSADVDIDHTVPMSEAYRSGAYAWTDQRKALYGNSLGYEDHLVVVDDATNSYKSDKDPADWLPPLSSYTCEYLADWLRIKSDWNLSIDAEELHAIEEAIDAYSCE